MYLDNRFTRRYRHILLPTVAAALIAGVAGCSSSSNSSDSTDTTAGASSIPATDVVSAVGTDATIRAELPAAVRAQNSLSLGTTLAPGVSGLPHAGQQNGVDVGVDVDLRNAVAKVLGVTWKVENGTFATIIPGVQNSKYDVGQDNFAVTKARVRVVDFASYLTDGQAVLGRKDLSLDKVTDVTDLCGLTVATSPGSTFQQILTTNAGRCAAAGRKNFTVQYFADTAPIFLGLANGKVDAYFGPTLSLQYDAGHVAGTKFLGQLSSTTVGFVTAKGSPLAKPLSDAVNALIADGNYAKILGKWGVLAGSGITSSKVNPAGTL